jgi:hypothetical protein
MFLSEAMHREALYRRACILCIDVYNENFLQDMYNAKTALCTGKQAHIVTILTVNKYYLQRSIKLNIIKLTPYNTKL